MKVPAISVIIPMYNVEKYIGECLDSLLAQTFKDFEVIVVDDCSTDNSCVVVESYAKKFGGRLKLTHTKKNTGGAGLPRNKGIELSRGEYLSFIDPDDTITPTAFKELYNLAKKSAAEVVHCEKWYELPDEFYHDAEHRKNLKPYSWPAGEKIFINQPIMLTNDLERRIVDFSKGWLTWSVCLQLVRRDFIVDNEIKFANVHCEDMLFTMCELSCAEKYIVVPNVFYFYRLREGSAIRENLDVQKIIHKYSSGLKYGINYLDDFLNGQKFFAQRADLKYILFGMFANELLGCLNKIYYQIPYPELDKFLRQEFAGDNEAFSAFLFNLMNVYRLQLNETRRKLSAQT